MPYNTTASSNNLTCTDYVDFGYCQDRFGQILWFKNDSTYLDLKRKVFKKDDKEGFRQVQNLTVGQSDFNIFRRWKNHPVTAAENFGREGTFSPFLIPTMSKNMGGQLKLAHKLVHVVDRPNRKICVTLQRYNVARPENSYA